jgi:uncharacterized protein (DUF305 family)
MKRSGIVLAAAGVFAISGGVFAQHSGHGGHSNHGNHAGHGAAKASDSAATKAFRAANDKMHKDMDIAFTGDPDADFARGMIPHHQGAIDMAKIVLQYGKDPEIRKLAEEVVKAQESEIKFMREWLAKRGVK